MTDNIYQCCYTNATKNIGGQTRSGWDAVACSDDMPSDAKTQCINLQRANSANSRADEDRKEPDLLEISGDDKFVYIIRTRYGLVDREQRPNIFSHAYILPWKDVLPNPAFLLKVADRQNYRTSAEEAEALLKAGEWRFASEAEYGEIMPAMEKAGMDEKTYPILIRCVYAQVRARKGPLYIRCDGEEQMLAILFCIYWGLPYHIRKRLHTVSAAISNNTRGNTKDKNIVFTRSLQGTSFYIDPRTGEQNVLTPNLEEAIAKLGFADYAVTHLDQPEYSGQLMEKAVRLGGTETPSEQILKLAHRQLTGQSVDSYTVAELQDSLWDALRSGAGQSTAMRDYIVQMLERVMEEKLRLPEAYEPELAAWRASSVLSKEEVAEKDRLEKDMARMHQARLDKERSVIEEQLDKEYEARRKQQMDETDKKIDKHKEDYEKIRMGSIAKTIENAEKLLSALDNEVGEARKQFHDLAAGKTDRQALEKYLDRLISLLGDAGTQASKWNEKKERDRKILENSLKMVEDKAAQQEAELKSWKEAELKKQYAEIERRLEDDVSEELRRLRAKVRLTEVSERYITMLYCEILSPEEAAAKLIKLPPKTFAQYVTLLAAAGKKSESLLRRCFTDQLNSGSVSWETLNTLAKTIKDLNISDWSLTDSITKAAKALYSQQRQENIKFVPDAYNQYRNIVERISRRVADIDRYEKEAKREFWDNVHLKEFPAAVYDEYRPLRMDFGSETPRYKMIDRYCQLLRDISTKTDSDLLMDIQEFFHSKFQFPPDEREYALQQFCEKAEIRPGDPYFAEWIEAAAEASSLRLCSKIIAVRKALVAMSGPQYAGYLLSHGQLESGEGPEGKEILQRIDRIALKIFVEADSVNTPVPLDVWLVLGKSIWGYQNIFSVFGHEAFQGKQAAIFQCDGATVVAESKLFTNVLYKVPAEEFSRGSSSEAKAVKSWLKQALGGSKFRSPWTSTNKHQR